MSCSQPWQRRCDLLDVLLTTLASTTPPQSRSERWERQRTLDLAIALGAKWSHDPSRDPLSPCLNAERELLGEEMPSPKLLQDLCEAPIVPPRALLEESFARWISHASQPTSAYSLWASALSAHLVLLSRVYSIEELRCAISKIPAGCLDEIIAGSDSIAEGALALSLTEEWSRRGQPTQPSPSWWRAAYATALTQPTSRGWILDAQEPLHEFHLLQLLQGVDHETIRSLFSGRERRWEESCVRLLLPLSLLIEILDPAHWHDAIASALALEQTARAREERMLGLYDGIVGDGIRVLVRARVKGGWATLIPVFTSESTEPVGSVRAFLPGSQLDRAIERETLVGKQLDVVIFKRNHRRGTLVVSQTAASPAGPPDADIVAALCAMAASNDPAHAAMAWSAPFSRSRAIVLVGQWEALSALRCELLAQPEHRRELWVTWAEGDPASALCWAVSGPADPARGSDMDISFTHSVIRWLDTDAANAQGLSGDAWERAIAWLTDLVSQPIDVQLRVSALARLGARVSVDTSALLAWSSEESPEPLRDEAMVQLACAGDRSFDERVAGRWPDLSAAQQSRLVIAAAHRDLPLALARFEAFIASWTTSRDGVQLLRDEAFAEECALALAQTHDPAVLPLLLSVALRLGPSCLGAALHELRTFP